LVDPGIVSKRSGSRYILGLGSHFSTGSLSASAAFLAAEGAEEMPGPARRACAGEMRKYAASAVQVV
jgi:hypothetical protein